MVLLNDIAETVSLNNHNLFRDSCRQLLPVSDQKNSLSTGANELKCRVDPRCIQSTV